MKIQRSHLRIAVVVLAAAVLWNLWGYFKPAARTSGPVSQQAPLLQGEAPAGEAQGAQAVDPLTIPAPPDVNTTAAPSGSRDPFLFGNETRDARTQAAAEESVPDPAIRSILFSATRRTAIIDTRMVSVGDMVGSLKVAEIERDAVVFVTSGGARRRVPLHRASPPGLTR